ncbi:hypothetical protein ANO14919_122070 [Xylariales sp. No.14919]|nr:hypothetical protein ANO14919_122070 [Xylariales sp. No.14919]
MEMRMMRANAVEQYRLRKNYRAMGFASAIASTIFYDRAMEEATIIPEDEYNNHEVGIKVKRDKFAEAVNEEQLK